MKKSRFIIAAAVLAAASAVRASGCFLLPKYSDPKSIDIDGETYVTGFYGAFPKVSDNIVKNAAARRAERKAQGRGAVRRRGAAL